MRSKLKLVLLLLALGGCEQPGPYYDPGQHQGRVPTSPHTLISTNAVSYPAGTPVSIRLTNTTGRAVGYNLCHASLERDQDGGWGRMQQTLGEVCTAELRTLGPGQSATFAFRSSPHLRPGTYRVRADLRDLRGGASLEVYSNSFNITRESDS